MKEEYVNAFLAPAKLVWEAELKQPLEFTGARLASKDDIPEDVTAVIGVSGALEGSVRYEFGKGTGLAVAGTMMGESLEEHDEISMSALGEIANMISGNAAANLYEQGFTCEITPPKFCKDGSDIPEDFPGAQIIAAFTSDLGPLNIRIGLAETNPTAETDETSEAVETEDVDPRFARYTGRVRDVMGYAPPKRRY